jgi:C_GCAxxG_C_C family probable redox protein
MRNPVNFKGKHVKETENALALWNNGNACSQSVLGAFAERYGLSEETALKLSCSFAGGLGGLGLTCGAVTGALMVLGLEAGRVDPTDQAARDRNDELVRRFVERFQGEHGSIICDELTGVPHADPQALQKAKDEGHFDRICTGLVKRAAELVSELIEPGR